MTPCVSASSVDLLPVQLVRNSVCFELYLIRGCCRQIGCGLLWVLILAGGYHGIGDRADSRSYRGASGGASGSTTDSGTDGEADGRIESEANWGAGCRAHGVANCRGRSGEGAV